MSRLPYDVKLRQAEEAGDAELAAYYREQQAESVKARKKREAWLETRRLPPGKPVREPHPQAQI